MNISIIGLGFVGNAMLKTFEFKKIKNIKGYDKFKNGGIGTFENCLDTDIMFLCLPTLYDENIKSYNLEPIKETLFKLNKFNYQGIIVIKSTIEPDTTDFFAKKYPNLNLIHNPEFLTARTAYKDFLNQKHIVLGKSELCDDNKFNMVINFYKKLWPIAEISICNAKESEIMKLGCNSFYAVKIQFFNELYLLSHHHNIDYNKVKNMMINNKWINPMHTNVPGHDGKLSYGGLCFPKDTYALSNHFISKNITNKVLEGTINERNMMRNDNLNYIKKINHHYI